MAVLNILYDVGARDEDPEQTGFAHLFEHLMFGGSVNIPHYDGPLQRVGGENNAFTSNDITNYYITLPSTQCRDCILAGERPYVKFGFLAKKALRYSVMWL
jgi:predicted Zn-dependent peptidase